MQKPNYYKNAFQETFNLIVLFILVIATVLFQRLAVTIGFFELLYLIIFPNLAFYRNYVNFKLGYQENSNPAIVNDSSNLYELPSELRIKCEKIKNKYNDIVKIASKNRRDLPEHVLKEEMKNLKFLLDKHIDFSVSIGNYQKYLDNNQPTSIMDEIEKLKHRIIHCYDDIKSTNDLDLYHKRMQKRTLLKENLEILEKRLDKVKNLKGTIEKLKAETDIIEDTFNLVCDHIMMFDPNESVNVDWNNIISNVQKTERVIKDTQSEMNKFRSLSQENINQY